MEDPGEHRFGTNLLFCTWSYIHICRILLLASIHLFKELEFKWFEKLHDTRVCLYHSVIPKIIMKFRHQTWQCKLEQRLYYVIRRQICLRLICKYILCLWNKRNTNLRYSNCKPKITIYRNTLSFLWISECFLVHSPIYLASFKRVCVLVFTSVYFKLLTWASFYLEHSE